MSRHRTDTEVYVTDRENVKSFRILGQVGAVTPLPDDT
jgi:hypothetical protein